MRSIADIPAVQPPVPAAGGGPAGSAPKDPDLPGPRPGRREEPAEAGTGPDAAWRRLPAAQRPPWPDERALAEAAAEVAARPALVPPHEIRALTRTVAAAARGECLVLQSGDCAETFDPPERGGVAAAVGLLHAACEVLGEAVGLPVVPVGRIAGQYAKPRSAGTETVGGAELPVYRGHAVNDPRPDAALRVPDPRRLLLAHDHARAVVERLREAAAVDGLTPYEDGGDRFLPGRPALWTSHEALLLDYEDPQVRTDPRTGARYLTSTHLPWIGARTNRPDGAHVAFAARVANTVGVKVAPDTDAGALLQVCRRLDPHREPGRLVLIGRFGADRVAGALPPLAAAVRQAGHPAVWLCDPMHGNTETVRGVKTRRLGRVLAEIRGFAEALGVARVRPGGLHLEATAEPVTECLEGGVREDHLLLAYRTACDPRLNPAQTGIAVHVAAEVFGAAAGPARRGLPPARPVVSVV